MTLRPWRSGAAAAFAQREAQQPRQYARQAALHLEAAVHARGRRAQPLEVRREQRVPVRVRRERPGEGLRQPGVRARARARARARVRVRVRVRVRARVRVSVS